MQGAVHGLSFGSCIETTKQFVFAGNQGLFSLQNAQPNPGLVGFKQGLQVEIAPGA